MDIGCRVDVGPRRSAPCGSALRPLETSPVGRQAFHLNPLRRARPGSRSGQKAPEGEGGDGHVHVGVLDEQGLRAEVLHQDRGERWGGDRGDAIGEQKPD